MCNQCQSDSWTVGTYRHKRQGMECHPFSFSLTVYRTSVFRKQDNGADQRECTHALFPVSPFWHLYGFVSHGHLSRLPRRQWHHVHPRKWWCCFHPFPWQYGFCHLRQRPFQSCDVRMRFYPCKQDYQGFSLWNHQWKRCVYRLVFRSLQCPRHSVSLQHRLHPEEWWWTVQKCI